MYETNWFSLSMAWFGSLWVIYFLLLIPSRMIKKKDGFGRLFIVYIYLYYLGSSVLPWVLFQMVLGEAYLFQSITSLLSGIYLALYIPFVFGLLYIIGLILPIPIAMMIHGGHNTNRVRKIIAGVSVPLIFFIFSIFFGALNPIASKTVRVPRTHDIIAAGNGPGFYIFKYVLEPHPRFYYWRKHGKLNGIDPELLSVRDRMQLYIAYQYTSSGQFNEFMHEFTTRTTRGR